MAKSDTTYRYNGSLSGATLDDGREVMLHPGGEVQLPADNDYVKALVAQGFLTEVAAADAPAEIRPTPPLPKAGAKEKEVTDSAS